MLDVKLVDLTELVELVKMGEMGDLSEMGELVEFVDFGQFGRFAWNVSQLEISRFKISQFVSCWLVVEWKVFWGKWVGIGEMWVSWGRVKGELRAKYGQMAKFGWF